MPQPNGRNLPAPLMEPSPVLDPDAARAPVSHQLPPHVSKAGRIGDHLAAISADLREIVELRIELLKVELSSLTDKIDGYKNKVDGLKVKLERFADLIDHFPDIVKFAAPAVVLAFYLLGFVLATLAIGIGWALGHLFWGALIVTGLLFVVVGVLATLALRRYKRANAITARQKPTPKAEESDAATPGPKTRHQLQDLEREHARQSTT